jgi:hypothetical protein
MNFVCQYLAEIYPQLNFERNLKNKSGDIFTTEDFPFVIEVKNQERWRYSHFFGSDRIIYSHIKDFWAQVTRDVDLLKKQTKVAKIPWLVFTKNREPYYFMFSREHVPTEAVLFLLKKVHWPVLIIPGNKLIVFPSPTVQTMGKFLAYLHKG